MIFVEIYYGTSVVDREVPPKDCGRLYSSRAPETTISGIC
jgi:hypothetical protein